jgi:alanine racemase
VKGGVGEIVGYGARYSSRNPPSAVVPAGYAMGLTADGAVVGADSRQAGAHVGAVTDMMTVDVSDLQETGDEVVIIGGQGGQHRRPEIAAGLNQSIWRFW